ncbi:hypothetical protein BD626DRAFT_509769 [Schizophyllum amplum]|uniref:Uncharacterized protein n=1 Tax=Schizophyllum amplum TaxID=97359 RepID=A0A550C2S2_9AGAR|nr:hypothetical protein BD626DRAFT_509769 [Auriculariopsis ampla]
MTNDISESDRRREDCAQGSEDGGRGMGCIGVQSKWRESGLGAVGSGVREVQPSLGTNVHAAKVRWSVPCSAFPVRERSTCAEGRVCRDTLHIFSRRLALAA